MHYLINQYRPHQARETLIMEMEEQLERVRRETEENREATRKVDEALLKVEEVSRQVRLVEERGEVHRAGETGDEKAKRRDLEGWELMMGAA